MGWLRVLSEWVGPAGTVAGCDIDEKMLAMAREFAHSSGLANVRVERDDLFDSRLPAGTFDLVHARFQIASLGRADEQLASFRRLAAPGGWIVLEEADWSSWQVHPDAPASARLVNLIAQGFRAAGGCLGAGAQLPALLEPLGERTLLDAAIVAMPPGHPFLRLPVQFAGALRARLVPLVGAEALDELVAQADAELSTPKRWGTTYTLIQAAVQVG